MDATDVTPSVVPLAPAERAPQRCADPHARAEELLGRANACTDDDRRRRLQGEAVLLTLDIADSTARRYRGKGVDLEDLVQVARLALVKAVRGYQPEKSRGGFAAYAVPTVTGEIRRHFRDCAWVVRPPRRLQELRGTLAAEETRMAQRLGRQPTDSELAQVVGVAVEAVDQTREAARGYRWSSLDGPAGTPTVDVPDHRDHAEELVTRDAVAWALGRLRPRERRILVLRFVHELTQSQIGAEIGVSQMQVSRLLDAILASLRASLVESGAA